MCLKIKNKFCCDLKLNILFILITKCNYIIILENLFLNKIFFLIILHCRSN